MVIKAHGSESHCQEKTCDNYWDYFTHMTMSTFYSTQN